jgi:hypothetical protein
VPGNRIDQWNVRAVLDEIAVTEVADVDRVGEQHAQRREAPARAAVCRGDPRLLEEVGHLDERRAGSAALKCLAHCRAMYRVGM